MQTLQLNPEVTRPVQHSLQVNYMAGVIVWIVAIMACVLALNHFYQTALPWFKESWALWKVKRTIRQDYAAKQQKQRYDRYDLPE